MMDGVDVRLLGQHLHRVRKERKKRLTQVWEETGVSVASLSRIERGGSQGVDAKTLLALCDWMGRSVEMFKENPISGLSSTKKSSTTPDAVELHLRADKNLDRKTANALSILFRTAYEQMSKKS
jgi:transcriptional regulator with XRE-family HTH domain